MYNYPMYPISPQLPTALHAYSDVIKRNRVVCCPKIKSHLILLGQCPGTRICWGCFIIGIHRDARKANLIKRNREIYPAMR